MNNFRKFALAVVLGEVILFFLWNASFHRRSEGNQREYMVDISRIIRRMEAGEAVSAIDLKAYPYVCRVSPFDPEENVNQPYAVEEVAGRLYRFEYRQETDPLPVFSVRIFLIAVILGTAALFIYLERTLIAPFGRMTELPEELARGNLSRPLKEEKSRYFGRFLWGMDMLREKLEEDKARELRLIREKKTLILSLSHDIHTPLSAIALYGKALKSGLYESPEKTRAACLGIEANVEKIRDFVEEIAEASKEDFLSLEVHNGEVYLGECLREIEVYYREKLEILHTAFSVEAAEDCLICGDKDRIVEVMQNVLENAVKYGDGQRVEITFGEEGGYRLVTIGNSGNGVLPEELPHVFEAFFRGRGKERTKGSGLGLYIARELMHRMGGEIYGETTEDYFAVTLVLKKA